MVALTKRGNLLFRDFVTDGVPSSGKFNPMKPDLRRYFTQVERYLDTGIETVVIDKDLSAPPVSPEDGDSYIVAASATDEWAGHETEVATWDELAEVWTFNVPLLDRRVWVSDEKQVYFFADGHWNVGQQSDVALNVRSFGAKCDGVVFATTVSITVSTNMLAVSDTIFAAGDVGKLILVPGAGVGGAALVTTIASFVDDQHVTLSNNASTTLSAVSARVTFGSDDTDKIQNAIDALPDFGGDIVLIGMSCISGQISIGNGTSTTFSTRSGVRFIGRGMSGSNTLTVSGFLPFARKPTAALNWIGAVNGTMLKICGPLRGWDVSNIIFEGNAVAGFGLSAWSAGDFATWNLVFEGCRTVGYHTQAYTTAGVSGSVNTEMGLGGNITVHQPDVTSSVGLLFDGATDGTASSCFITLQNVRVFPSVTNTNYAVIFKVADTVRIIGLLVFHTAAAPVNSIGVLFDYGGNATFPCGCILDTPDVGWNLPLANQFVNSGSAAGAGSQNIICNLTELNGARYPTSLDNVRCDIPHKLACDVSLTGQTAANAGQIIATPKIAGIYRLSYYGVITTAGSAGTITPQIGWNDGAGRGANLAAMGVSTLGSVTSGCFTLFCAANQPISFLTLFGSVTGSPQYSMYFRLERMN